MGIMLPTLRKERQATYSPVLPVSPKSGVVLQVPVEVVDGAGVVVLSAVVEWFIARGSREAEPGAATDGGA